MATEVEQAKEAITDQLENDPELSETFRSAHALQLDLEKEKHRHVETTQKSELGMIGRLLGGERVAPTFIAGLAVILGLIAYGISLWCASHQSESKDLLTFWTQSADRSLAFAAASLAYIFGRGSK